MERTPAERLAALRARAAKRREECGNRGTYRGSPDIPDWLREAQWRTETWTRA